jgi:polyvinyl alcohol dehydrogenase (cytochrome)
MHTCFRPIATSVWFSGVSLAVVLWASVANAGEDAKDWPTYNADVIGTRHNRGETAIDKSNAARLEEKWRFPTRDSKVEIGVIHATPVVVGGYVYFGTATEPTFYKLTPDGKVRWSYRNPLREKERARIDAKADSEKQQGSRFRS